jgi:hypothetical protein
MWVVEDIAVVGRSKDAGAMPEEMWLKGGPRLVVAVVRRRR